MTQGARLAGALALLLVSTGCGNSERVDVYEVKGRVLFEGKPMIGGGTIAFVPVGGQSGKTAGGEIKEDGTYELTTYRPGDGSMAGDFRVVISQVVEKEPEPTPDGQPVAPPTPTVPVADRIPLIYSNHQHSPLEAKVEAKSSNEINFDLKRDVPPPPGGRRPGEA